jgi:hypothetical protein
MCKRVCMHSPPVTRLQVWDQRAKRSVITFSDKFQVTAVQFADAGDQVYSGGLDNTIKVRPDPTLRACSPDVSLHQR